MVCKNFTRPSGSGAEWQGTGLEWIHHWGVDYTSYKYNSGFCLENLERVFQTACVIKNRVKKGRFPRIDIKIKASLANFSDVTCIL